MWILKTISDYHLAYHHISVHLDPKYVLFSWLLYDTFLCKIIYFILYA